MTLVEFLLARIAEVEKKVRVFENIEFPEPVPGDAWGPVRVLAECEAKRQVITEHKADRPDLQEFEPQSCRICYYNDDQVELVPCPTLRMLAAVYAAHPDYQQDWAL